MNRPTFAHEFVDGICRFCGQSLLNAELWVPCAGEIHRRPGTTLLASFANEKEAREALALLIAKPAGSA